MISEWYCWRFKRSGLLLSAVGGESCLFTNFQLDNTDTMTYLFFPFIRHKELSKHCSFTYSVWYYHMIRVKFTSLIFLDCLLKTGILINNHIIIQKSSSNFTLTDIKICMSMFPDINLLKYLWTLELVAGENSGHCWWLRWWWWWWWWWWWLWWWWW